MLRIFSSSLLLVAAATMAGCSNSPYSLKPVQVNERDYLFATDVAFAAKCEMDSALKFLRNDNELGPAADRFWIPQAAADLTLKVTGNKGARFAPSFTFPVNSVVVTLGGSLNQTRKTTKTLNLKMGYTEEDEPRNCDEALVDSSQSAELPKPIVGELGLEEWIKQLAKIAQELDEAPTSASFNIEFAIADIGIANSEVTKTSIPGSRFRSFSFAPAKSKDVTHTFAVSALICDKKNPSINSKVCIPKNQQTSQTKADAAQQTQNELNNFLLRLSDD